MPSNWAASARRLLYAPKTNERDVPSLVSVASAVASYRASYARRESKSAISPARCSRICAAPTRSNFDQYVSESLRQCFSASVSGASAARRLKAARAST